MPWWWKEMGVGLGTGKEDIVRDSRKELVTGMGNGWDSDFVDSDWDYQMGEHYREASGIGAFFSFFYKLAQHAFN